MKTKISHLGRSAVSVILAVMMLLSTMLVGTVSTVNAVTKKFPSVNLVGRINGQENWESTAYPFTFDETTGYWYLDITITQKSEFKARVDGKWDISFGDSNGGNCTIDEIGDYRISVKDGSDDKTDLTVQKTVKKVADSVTLTANPTSVKVGNSVTLTPTVSSAKPGNLTYTYNKISGGTATEVQNADNSLTVTPTVAGTYKYTVTVSADGYSPVTSNEVNFEVTEDASVVTDTRLISVLDGSKVMFYGGEESGWNQNHFVAMNTKNTDDVADSAKTDYGKKLTVEGKSIDFKFGILCVPAGTYYMGHSNWAPNLRANVVAGDAFVIYNKTINGFNEVAKDGGNLLLQSVSTGTKTATTTLSANKVATGGLLGVTTSPQAGSSSLGFANTFEYYVLNKKTNKFYKVTLSDGMLDTSAFTDEGEYEVKTVLKDANGLYVLADSDNFVISNKAKYSVTFGSNDANMGKVTVSDGTNSYTTSPASVEEGKSVTFTATAENGYRFDGWYSNAGCTTAIEGATGAPYTTTVTADTTVYAKFVAETYNITVEENTNCTVTVNKTAAYGSKVNVRVNAKDGYTVSSISVTNVNADDITGNETEGYTFRMPASNVEITPNVVAVEVTAPNVTLNTVTGESTADVSVKENYPITAFAEAGDAYSKITSKDISVSGGVENTNYTWAETSDGSGIYNFVALTKGTFTVTYTATATSKNDITKSTSATATLNITASYTPTQQAYVDLENYVKTVKDTSAGSYTTDSYAAFSVALTSAQALLKGLPNADATNASDYTNAKTALETAFKGLEKDVTYYIGGRFKGQKWSSDTKTMPFVKVEGKSNLYKYETNMTVSQLSATVSSDNNQKQYFFIHTGKGRDQESYYASESSKGYEFHKNTINKQLTLKKLAAGTDVVENYIKFDNTSDSSSNVVLYLDTSDKDNLKLYYSADIDPDYRITGTLANAGGWSHKFASSMKFDTLESDGSYSKEVSISDADIASGKNYFRLINNDSYQDGSQTVNKEYGPYTKTGQVNKDVNICDFNTKTGAYGTYWNNGTAFYFNDAGTYKIHYIYNTTKSAPDIWVEKVSIEYNVTVDSGVSATVDKAKAAEGETVTVTATSIPQGQILDTVTVVGKNGSTPIETTVIGNTATFTMPNQDVTVTGVTFRPANTYTVTFSSSNDNFGTVSAKYNSADFTSGGTVTEGGTVTFTAKPEDGYALSGWTVNNASVSPTTNPYTITVNSTTTVVANFKVEDSGTIVNDMYFLYGSKNDPRTWEGQQGYNNTEYGKYDVYKKDGKYIVTLNEKHYKELYFAFSKDESYVNMEPNTGLKPVNSVNPEGLSLVDAKTQEYYVGSVRYLFGKMNIVSENSEYIGDIKIIYDPTANTYTVKATKDSVSDTTVNIVGKDGTIRGGYYGKTTSALGNTELKVTLPDSTTTITAIDSCEFDGKPPQGVTAKKVPYGSKVTVKTTIKSDANFAGHKGSDYYVKGFSINGFTGGVLTQQAGNSHEGDVYEYTFTVNKDVYADVSTIEITPIYFLKNDSDCITFYVENFMDAKAKWGDTIACYAYYSSGNDSGNALGDYPGQPMVNAEGSIYMQIPKHIGTDTSNVVKGITLNNYVWDFVHVSGGDDVRKQKNCQTYDYDDFKYLANMSKVNSSDSAADIKNIVYRFKYHTYNNTSAEAGNVPKDTLTGTTVDNTKYEVFVDYYDKPTDIFGTIINGNDAVTVDTVKAESEYLTIVSDGYVNYYKDTAKYLGQYATKWYIYNKAGQKVAALPPSALLYGLTKSSTQLENLVTQDTAPADFMSDSGASTSVISGYWASFKSLYTDYAGKYAIINYESAIHSSGRDGAEAQPGERCDGRWYYSVDKANITGDIKIEYADTLESFTTMTGVKTDTFIEGTATGTNTAAEAYFTSPVDQSDARLTHVETTSDNSENFMFTVGATSSTTSGYTFVGWYRLIDDTYKAVNDPSELNKTTGQVARNANVVLVARYIKTPGGSMTFHHSLYNGENAGGGKATTKIQVVVKSSDDSKEYYKSGIIDSTASIDQKTISKIVADQQDAKITVTLYTTTMNLYNFNGYYSAENTPVTKLFTTGFTTTVSGNRTEGFVTTSEYTFSFNEYYNKYAGILTAPDAGTVYYNFYSDITSIKVPYKVQFSYKDRTGEQKYYNKAGYVDPENTSSYTIVEDGNDVKVTLTDSFILSLAPYESNFTKDLTWNKTPDSNTAFDSSATNSIASAVVNSTQSDKKIHLNIYKDSKGNPTPLINDAGEFKLYQKDGSFDLPYGSVFYTKSSDGTYTYDITAPKTYADKDGKTLQFMYWAIYSDSECKNLVIKAYNSDGAFSYVAYDNCWIAPVYGESSTPSASVKEVSTSTQFMEVTRNQWTADNADSFTGFDADSMKTLDTAEDFIKGNGEDKLYADFVLNFFYNGKQLSVFDPNSENVKAGVLIQRLELDKNETGTGYITDLDHYANKYDETALTQAKNDAISKITTNKSDIISVKQQINNNRLDNKNRLQYYTRFNNVKGNNDCVFRLYTYIQYTGADSKPVVELSNPVYFTFYDIANKS